MQFEAIFGEGQISDPWQVYSLGGGAIGDGSASQVKIVYDLNNLADVMKRCDSTGQAFWEYVEEREG